MIDDVGLEINIKKKSLLEEKSKLKIIFAFTFSSGAGKMWPSLLSNLSWGSPPHPRGAAPSRGSYAGSAIASLKTDWNSANFPGPKGLKSPFSGSRDNEKIYAGGGAGRGGMAESHAVAPSPGNLFHIESVRNLIPDIPMPRRKFHLPRPPTNVFSSGLWRSEESGPLFREIDGPLASVLPENAFCPNGGWHGIFRLVIFHFDVANDDFSGLSATNRSSVMRRGYYFLGRDLPVAKRWMLILPFLSTFIRGFRKFTNESGDQRLFAPPAPTRLVKMETLRLNQPCN